MDKIFEAVNADCDEQYYTIGVWQHLQDAIDAVSVDDPTDLDDSFCGNDDFAKVEIREREFGFSGLGKTVHVVTWKADWSGNGPKWTRTHKDV